MTKMMTVREVAEYLNIKERKVYDLVSREVIPCSRVAGKWLFPQALIDSWVNAGVGAQGQPAPAPPAPPVVAGSHDPLLEWCLRESACGLALMAGGSMDGLRRLEKGEARMCGLHVLNATNEEYNVEAVQRHLGTKTVVLIQWAWRRQGLLTAPDNPLDLQNFKDLRQKRPRLVQREEGAGTRLLLAHLMESHGMTEAELTVLPRVARSHTDVGLAILEGQADTGMAAEAVARQMQLGFIPLHRERYDLVMLRRDYFEPAFQTLLAFTSTAGFQQRAADLGYDVSELGRVRYNAQ